MEQLINISEKDGLKAVSSFELYKLLGYNVSNFSRWVKRYIIENDFFIKGVDWFELVTDDEKQPDNSSFMTSNVSDYVITIDLAKRVAMLARTEMGEKVRTYFLEVEKRAIQQSNTAKLIQMRDLETKIQLQKNIVSEANEELRFLNKCLKNVKTELYGQLPKQEHKSLPENYGQRSLFEITDGSDL